MAYKLRTDYLKDAPLHRSFGQMQKPYKYVTIHNAASSTTAKNLADVEAWLEELNV